MTLSACPIVTADEFRHAMGHFATGVTVVTSVDASGAPVGTTANVLAVLECTVEHSLPGGDHEIIVGRVRHVETSPAPVAPLLYYRGSYAQLAS
jgi:flavin reductase (DIM6/NTAB) family NADH-FMN oxidoreductase RutF